MTPPPVRRPKGRKVFLAEGQRPHHQKVVGRTGSGVKKTAIILLLGVSLAACSGRLPSTERSKEIIRRHFDRYGKKYESSPFGKKKVTDVEILKQEEIHKQLVAIQSFVTVEGPDVFKVRVVLEKGPLGWRTIAWENLSGN